MVPPSCPEYGKTPAVFSRQVALHLERQTKVCNTATCNRQMQEQIRSKRHKNGKAPRNRLASARGCQAASVRIRFVDSVTA